MGELDRVAEALKKRKEKPQEDSRAEELLRATGALDQLISKWNRDVVDPERFEKVMGALFTGTQSIGQKLDGVHSALEKKPEDFAPILTELSSIGGAVKSLKSGIDNLVKAINGIKLPEPEPFPEIPKTDLEPLYRHIDASMELLAQRPPEVIQPVEAPETPRNWTFSVKRNRAGYIREVEAKSV